jgi:hypothetical protein
MLIERLAGAPVRIPPRLPRPCEQTSARDRTTGHRRATCPPQPALLCDNKPLSEIEAKASLVALDTLAVALHLMDPVRPRWDLPTGRRQAELIRNTHRPKIGRAAAIANLGRRTGSTNFDAATVSAELAALRRSRIIQEPSLF